jgi:surface-anchored protein
MTKPHLACMLLLGARTIAHGAVVLTHQHIDLSINFNPTFSGGETNPWLLTVRDEDARREYAGQRAGYTDPLRATLLVSEFAAVEIPDDPAFAFLGEAGTLSWILPETQDPALLYAGFSTENKSAQIGWQGDGVNGAFLVRGLGQNQFIENTIRLSLASFSGPGQFHLYTLDEFGEPTVHFDTTDGLSALDFRDFSPALHAHFNFAFSAPGDYFVGLRAIGFLVPDGIPSESEVTVFHFQVIPEPSSVALVALGTFPLLRRRRPSSCLPLPFAVNAHHRPRVRR